MRTTIAATMATLAGFIGTAVAFFLYLAAQLPAGIF